MGAGHMYMYMWHAAPRGACAGGACGTHTCDATCSTDHVAGGALRQSTHSRLMALMSLTWPAPVGKK
eukprot:3701236-Prymnesium_polylepis.1